MEGKFLLSYEDFVMQYSSSEEENIVDLLLFY